MTMTPEKFANLYDPSVRSRIKVAASEVPDIASRIFTKPPMDISEESRKSRQYGAFGNWKQVDDGQPTPADAYFEGYGVEITPHEFKQVAFATQKEVEMDKPHNVLDMAKDMGVAYYQTYQELAADILNNAASSGAGGDGQYLASDAHPYSTKSPMYGATQDNLLTSTALTDANLKTARTALMKQLDERGKTFLDQTSKIYLVVPYDLEDSADIIVNSRLRSNVANNDKNVHEGRFEIVVWGKLTSTTTWFLVHPQNRLVALERVKMMLSEPIIDKFKWTVSWSGRSSIGFGFEDWRGVVMCTA